jgi:cell wall assembly regulator SMI1
VLGLPAAPARIAQAQRGTGAAFPAELIASLQRHEGTEAANGFTFPPFYALSSLDGLVRDAKTMCSVLTEPQLAWGAGTWWSGQWLPFAADHAGDSLFLAPNGKLGEHDNEASANFDRLPPDLPNLLEQTATALETGQPIIAGYRPKVQNGVLAWEIPR